MATIYWFDLRGTVGGPVGYPGDGANATYSLGNTLGTDPGVGPYTHGWGANNTGFATDKSGYATFARFGGYVSAVVATDQQTYQVTGLTVGHNYNLYLGLASISTSITIGYALYQDNRVTLLNQVAGTATTAGQILDATGTVRTDPTDWANNQVPYNFTAPTTSIYITKSSTNPMYLNTLGLEDLSSGGAAVGSTLLAMGVG